MDKLDRLVGNHGQVIVEKKDVEQLKEYLLNHTTLKGRRRLSPTYVERDGFLSEEKATQLFVIGEKEGLFSRIMYNVCGCDDERMRIEDVDNYAYECEMCDEEHESGSPHENIEIYFEWLG